jgi:hypothetical protein
VVVKAGNCPNAIWAKVIQFTLALWSGMVSAYVVLREQVTASTDTGPGGSGE